MSTPMDYADKIDKLLRMAESTTPAEAEAFRERAFALMTKYNVDQAEIDAKRLAAGGSRRDEQVIEKHITITGIYRIGLMQMSHSVAMAFESVRAYAIKKAYTTRVQTNGKTRWVDATEYHLIGFQSDVDQLVVLLTSLQMQAANEMVTWWKDYELRDLLDRGPAYRAKRQFIISFGHGAAQKIRLAQRRAAKGASEAAALVLYDRKQEIDKYVEQRFSLTKERSRLKGGAVDAEQAGYDAGQRANTGDTGIDNTSKRSLES